MYQKVPCGWKYEKKNKINKTVWSLTNVVLLTSLFLGYSLYQDCVKLNIGPAIAHPLHSSRFKKKKEANIASLQGQSRVQQQFSLHTLTRRQIHHSQINRKRVATHHQATRRLKLTNGIYYTFFCERSSSPHPDYGCNWRWSTTGTENGWCVRWGGIGEGWQVIKSRINEWTINFT